MLTKIMKHDAARLGLNFIWHKSREPFALQAKPFMPENYCKVYLSQKDKPVWVLTKFYYQRTCKLRDIL